MSQMLHAYSPNVLQNAVVHECDAWCVSVRTCDILPYFWTSIWTRFYSRADQYLPHGVRNHNLLKENQNCRDIGYYNHSECTSSSSTTIRTELGKIWVLMGQATEIISGRCTNHTATRKGYEYTGRSTLGVDAIDVYAAPPFVTARKSYDLPKSLNYLLEQFVRMRNITYWQEVNLYMQPAGGRKFQHYRLVYCY